MRDGDQVGKAGDPAQISTRAGHPLTRSGPSGRWDGSALAANGFAVAAPPTRPLSQYGPGGAGGNVVLPFVTRWVNDVTSQWPLRTHLELGALDGAVPSARLHARHVLWEWNLAGLRDTIELLVSELVTNGVQASRAMAEAAIRLWLFSDRTQVVILVWDASPQPPVRMDVGDDAENGRGLLLVETLSAQWGWHFPGEEGAPAGNHHGKFVWAIVLLPALGEGRSPRSPRWPRALYGLATHA